MNTKYILEYKYEDDTEWRYEEEYDYVSDAQHRLTEHVKAFNFIHVRVRQVKYVTTETIVGEYRPITVGEDA